MNCDYVINELFLLFENDILSFLGFILKYKSIHEMKR